MRYKILIIIFLLLHYSYFPESVFLNEEDKSNYSKLQESFKWLDKNLYFYVLNNSIKYDVDIKLICSVIYAESSGRNLQGSKNRNGTNDHGYMQVNDVHLRNEDDVRVLYNPAVNIEMGAKYLSKCLKKAKGDKLHAVRMYNQGMYGNPQKYNNWRYVSNVLNNYIKAKEQINENKI